MPSIQTWVTSPGMAAVWCSSSAGATEGVAGARHEQARHLEGREVLDAQALRSAGRVQRVAHEHQPGGGQPIGHGQGADAPAHRPAAEHDPVGGHAGDGGEPSRLLHHAREELRRTVRSLPPLAAVREVAPLDRKGRQGLFDGDEAGAGCRAARAWEQQDRSGLATRAHRRWAPGRATAREPDGDGVRGRSPEDHRSRAEQDPPGLGEVGDPLRGIVRVATVIRVGGSQQVAELLLHLMPRGHDDRAARGPDRARRGPTAPDRGTRRSTTPDCGRARRGA